MSLRWASESLTDSRLAVGADDVWVRPSDWLTMPTVSAGEQKVVLLVAVSNVAVNPCMFQCRGAYTVDWGDGTVTNYADNAEASHSYAWGDIPADTLTSRGYRQVIATITPQAGQNLTSLALVRTWPGSSGEGLTTPVLEATVGVTSPAGLALSSGVNSAMDMRMLEAVHLVASSGITMSTYGFYSCNSLQFVGGGSNLGSTTSFYGMFSSCSSLQSVALDTSSGTSFSTMFQNCYSLQSVDLDTSAGTNFSTMFQNCTSMQSVALDTSSGTSFSGMFQSCYALQSVDLDTSAGTNFTNMFNTCSSLQSVILTGCRYSVSVANCFLDAAALDALYTSLGTAAGAQTITVTGNPGTGSDNPSIATSKGWTVVGS